MAGMLNIPPTMSWNGSNSASADSTALKAVSSHAGRSRNRMNSTTAPTQNTVTPAVSRLQITPTRIDAMSTTTIKAMNASRLPVVNMVWMPSIM